MESDNTHLHLRRAGASTAPRLKEEANAAYWNDLYSRIRIFVVIVRCLMDPLSDVLSLLKLRSYWAAGFDAAGAWSMRLPAYEGIKCFALVSGRCWLAVDDLSSPILVEEGDCLLLPGGRPFLIGSDLTMTPVDAVEMFGEPSGVKVWNGGGECFGVGGHFTLAGVYSPTLLSVLPPIVQLKNAGDKATLRWLLEAMLQELREPQPGGDLVVQQLASVTLIRMLRLFLTSAPERRPGWIFALADHQLAPVMAAIHNSPAHAWTVRELAAMAGMSRTTFAVKFKRVVGASPMEYLTRWRMSLAVERMTNSGDLIASIATSLGYGSESAFSQAFRRVMGCSPRQYVRRRIPTISVLT
jgi:AraC-like DNA-binding protein